MDRTKNVTIHWKAVAQYFTVVLFVFQFYPVCNFTKLINFGPGTVRSERVSFFGRLVYVYHIDFVFVIHF